MLTSNLKVKGGFSELYLMDKNHIQRFYIASSENHGYIDELSNELSFKLKVNTELFNPK